jgi:hypothetical protein
MVVEEVAIAISIELEDSGETGCAVNCSKARMTA